MPRPLPLYSILTLSMLALAACGENATPTQPEMGRDPEPAVLSLAAVPNSWTPKAPNPRSGLEEFHGYDLGMAPDAAGKSIVYAFGGTDGEGGTGFSVQTYDVATDTWAARLSRVFVFNSNGVAKIGKRLYFSGGYDYGGGERASSNRLWAYDYSQDRMIQRAGLPIFGAEGVTGVINGKLYVLPGTCSGDGYPNPGYCAEERTRRFYRYDPAANTWVSRPWAPHFHRQGAAAVIDGKLYVAGGFKDFEPVADLDVYDPATNRWTTLAPLPTGGWASGAALAGQFYVVVQRFNGITPEYRTYAYNRSTNRWKAKAIPDVFGPLTRVTLDGRAHLFMAGGDQSALYTP